MPKSSMAMATPISRSALSVASAVSKSPISADSVISSSMQSSGTPTTSAISLTRPASAVSANCTLDRFTPTAIGGSPSCTQSLCWISAVTNTHSQIAMISPASSATGMNSLGGSRPSVGWFQRTRASTPTTAPVVTSICGW